MLENKELVVPLSLHTIIDQAKARLQIIPCMSSQAICNDQTSTSIALSKTGAVQIHIIKLTTT